MSAPFRRFALIAAYAAAFLASFALAKAVVALAGVEIYAKFALFLSFGVVLRIVWFGIVGTIFARGFTIARQEDSLSAFRNLLALALWAPVPVLALGGLGLAASGLRLSLGEIALSGADLMAGALLGASIGAAGALVEIANAMRMRALAITSMLYPPLIQIGAVWLLQAWGALDATWVAASAAAGCLLVQAVQWRALRRRIETARSSPARASRTPREIRSFLASSGLAMAMWIPPGLATRAADRWIVAAALPARDFAAFSIIMLLTQGAMSAAGSILGRVMLPQIYDTAGDGTDPTALDRAHRLIGLLSAFLLLSGIALVIFIALFGGWVLAYLGPDTFAAYHRELLLAGLAATLQSLGLAQLIHGHVRKTPAPYTRFRYAEAIAYLALIVVLLPRYGLTGLFLGACAAEALALALALQTTRSVTGHSYFGGRTRWR